jgi:hypothetical protein
MVTCKSCGAEIPADSKFCPKCGSPVEGGAGSGPGPQGTWDWREMKNDWRARRRGERRGWEWGWGPFWSEGWVSRWSWMWSPLWIMLNAVFLGLFIVGLGVLLFLAASGTGSLVDWENIWPYLLIFVGAMMVVRGIARYFVSGRRSWAHGISGGIVCATLGLAWLVALNSSWSQYLWAFVIVAGGLVVIVLGVINYFWMKAMPGK